MMTAISPAPEMPAAQRPHWVSRTAFQLLVILMALTQGALAFAVHAGAIWLAVPLVLVASHFMHGLLIGFHEASHGLLRKNRRLNEFDGVLMGVFSFMSFSLYRAAHQLHHAHLASERDEELWPFAIPGSPRWHRVLAAFFELNLGIVFTPFLFLRIFLRTGTPIRNKKLRRRVWSEFGLIVVVWSLFLGGVALFGAWKYFIWMYLAPSMLAANLQSWRKYIEHVGLKGSTVNSSTRSIVSKGWLGSLVSLTLLHEPYHGVHHWHPGLPHPELPEHAADLTPATPAELPPFPSYRHALAHLLRNLPDPRAGAQWERQRSH